MWVEMLGGAVCHYSKRVEASAMEFGQISDHVCHHSVGRRRQTG